MYAAEEAQRKVGLCPIAARRGVALNLKRTTANRRCGRVAYSRDSGA